MDLVQQQAQASHQRPFKDYFSPLANLNASCIRYPNIAVTTFELKTNVLNYLPSFYGLENEDLYNYLNDFMLFVNILNMKNF